VILLNSNGQFIQANKYFFLEITISSQERYCAINYALAKPKYP